MPASSRSGRYRADLIDVGWAPEHSYGVNPPAGSGSNPATGELGENDIGTDHTSLYRQWGIVNGGINLPNPTFAWTPFYGLGVDDRNMLFPIMGQETLEGGMPGAMLCHDSSRMAFEQMYGLIYNATNQALSTPAVAATGGTGWSTSTTTAVTATSVTLSGSVVSGSVIDFTAMGAPTATVKASPPTHIIMLGNPGETPNPWDCTWAYIGASGADTAVNVFQDRSLSVAGWNGKRPASGGTVKFAVHSVERIAGGSVINDGILRGTATTLKTVNVRPTLVQPSFMLGAKFRADDGSNFVTNYKGCKVSRFTISLEEGSPVTYNYDFIAQDMRHNIGEDVTTGTAAETARYAGLGVAATNTVDVTPMHRSRVTEQPYFFTGAEVKFHGVAFARLRSLTINVDNALDPRYYVTQSTTATATHNDRQILYEILEGRRTITLSGSVDLDDTGATQVGGSGAIVTDAKFLQYVLNQGMMDDDQRDMQTLKGISVEVELRKIKNADGSSGATHDVIKLQLPDPGKVTNNEGSTQGVGLFLNSAGIGVPAPPSVHIPQDFDGQASSLAIQFLDNSVS